MEFLILDFKYSHSKVLEMISMRSYNINVFIENRICEIEKCLFAKFSFMKSVCR